MSKRKLLIFSIGSAAAVFASSLSIPHTFAKSPALSGAKPSETARPKPPAETDAQRAAHEKTRLDQAVANGKLTSSQETLILAKQQEVKAQLDAIRTETDTTKRKADSARVLSELKTWATENNISEKWVIPPHGMHFARR